MQKPRILIVDDESEIRAILSDYLSDEYDVSGAADGLEALDLLRDEVFELVMTDYNMPGLNGLELIRVLRERSIQVPVLMLTGRGSQDLDRHSLAYGAFDYLEKPFHPERLKQAMEKCIKFPPTAQAAHPNAISRALYEVVPLKLTKDTVRKLETHCLRSGMSISTFLERLANSVIDPKQ